MLNGDILLRFKKKRRALEADQPVEWPILWPDLANLAGPKRGVRFIGSVKPSAQAVFVGGSARARASTRVGGCRKACRAVPKSKQPRSSATLVQEGRLLTGWAALKSFGLIGFFVRLQFLGETSISPQRTARIARSPHRKRASVWIASRASLQAQTSARQRFIVAKQSHGRARRLLVSLQAKQEFQVGPRLPARQNFNMIDCSHINITQSPFWPTTRSLTTQLSGAPVNWWA